MRVPFRKSKKIKQATPDFCVTQAMFEDLNIKLDRLKKYAQPNAISEVSRLAELGDFSENVEYQIAKGRLRWINNSILKLEKAINNASIIIPNKHNNVVQIGHTVTIERDGKQKKYQILGSSETDPNNGVISQNSPLGAALIGSRAADVIKIKFNNKEAEYKIVKIE